MIDINSIFIAKTIYKYSEINIFLKYNWAINCRDNNATIKL